MKRFTITFLLSAISTLILGSVLIHPSGDVKDMPSNAPLLAGARIDPQTLAILEKSCRNCHSEKTEWPWYSYVAPMSWLVEGDVSEARKHMNLSRWNDYTQEQKQQLLASIGAMVRGGKMPPVRYLALHAEAKLSPEASAAIYEWAHAERRRLKSTPPASLGAGF